MFFLPSRQAFLGGPSQPCDSEVFSAKSSEPAELLFSTQCPHPVSHCLSLSALLLLLSCYGWLTTQNIKADCVNSETQRQERLQARLRGTGYVILPPSPLLLPQNDWRFVDTHTVMQLLLELSHFNYLRSHQRQRSYTHPSLALVNQLLGDKPQNNHLNNHLNKRMDGYLDKHHRPGPCRG